MDQTIFVGEVAVARVTGDDFKIVRFLELEPVIQDTVTGNYRYPLFIKDGGLITTTNLTSVVRGSGTNSYVVVFGLNGWACSCPDHLHRQRECKHIRQVKEVLK